MKSANPPSYAASCSPRRPSPPNVAGNAGIAMFASVFYLATRLLVPPLVLAHLTLAEYGLWSACFILIMYIGLTDVGFSNVYVRFVARFHAEGDTASINHLLSTGVMTLGALSCAVLAALWLVLPHVLAFLKVEPALHSTAEILIMGSAAMFLLDLTLGAYCYLLHGLQRFREEKKVAIVGFVLEPILIFAFLQTGLGIYSLLLAFVLRYLWSLSSFARLAHAFVPGLELRPRHFDLAMLRHFFGFGAAVQASALLGTALFSLDRLMAGILLGPQGIALFELGAKLPNAAVSVPSAISNVAYPAAARHSAQSDDKAIRTLYTQTSRATVLLAGLPLGFMALFATPLSHIWLGPRAGLEPLPLILALGALSAHLHIATGPGSAVFRAMGKVSNEFVYHGLRIGALGLGIGISLAMLGATAISLAIGLALGGASAALAYLLHNHRRLGLPLSLLFRDLLLPGFVAYPLAALLSGLWQFCLSTEPGRWDALAWLACFGLLYVAAWAGGTWHLLHPNERAWVVLHLTRISNSFPRWRKT